MDIFRFVVFVVENFVDLHHRPETHSLDRRASDPLHSHLIEADERSTDTDLTSRWNGFKFPSAKIPLNEMRTERRSKISK